MPCQCGCGLKPNSGKRFLHGHNRRCHTRAQVLGLLLQGISVPQIATRLGVDRSLVHRELYAEAQHYGIPGGASLTLNLAVLMTYFIQAQR